ncbi:MAG: STY0301 family protein [Alphaproteobacteria bacterium]
MNKLPILAAITALAMPAAHASELCPASLTTTQTAAAVPAGFTASVEAASAPFMGLTFFDGKPSDKASLAPDEEKPMGETLVSTWTFPPGNPRGYYLRCSYFGTQIALQRALDPIITKCWVTYDMKQSIGGLPFIKRIDCM